MIFDHGGMRLGPRVCDSLCLTKAISRIVRMRVADSRSQQGWQSLQNPPCFQVIQPVADIYQTIDDHLRVSATVGGVDAVAGF